MNSFFYDSVRISFIIALVAGVVFPVYFLVAFLSDPTEEYSVRFANTLTPVEIEAGFNSTTELLRQEHFRQLLLAQTNLLPENPTGENNVSVVFEDSNQDPREATTLSVPVPESSLRVLALLDLIEAKHKAVVTDIAAWRLYRVVLGLTGLSMLVLFGFNYVRSRRSNYEIDNYERLLVAKGLQFDPKFQEQNPEALKKLRRALYFLEEAAKQMNAVSRLALKSNHWWSKAAKGVHATARKIAGSGIVPLDPLYDDQGPLSPIRERLERELESLKELEGGIAETINARVAHELAKYETLIADVEKLEESLKARQEALNLALDQSRKQSLSLEKARAKLDADTRTLEQQRAKLLRVEHESSERQLAAEMALEENTKVLNRIEAWAQQVGSEVLEQLRSSSDRLSQ